MIDKLTRHLGEEYALLNKSHGNVHIQIYRKSESGIDPETFIELIENEGKFHLSLVQRNKKFVKAEFIHINDAVFTTGLYAISKLGNPIQNKQAQNDILSLKPDDFSLLNNILSQEVGDEYFSIKQEKAKVINIEEAKNSDLFNIYYLSDLTLEKDFLVKERKAPNAFLVLYNFAVKLNKVQSLIDRWDEDFKVSQDQIELAKKLYLGIK